VSEPGQWDQDTTELALYILARDNEMETLKDDLTEHPTCLLALAKAGLHSAEQDARWQLADALGTVQADEDDVASILEAYVRDSNEYVSRRALLALGRRRSLVAETLARQAWDTGHEYQRIAALEVLSNLDSPCLSSYLDLAAQDGRQYVVGAAQRIRSDK
jgi:HEAT repeat protein